MHIGIDFDNTIAIYDNVFHKYALQLGLIHNDVRKDKKVIRDTIRLLPQGNDKWTELQGLVYGQFMHEAEMASGVEGFLNASKKKNVKISIISHKTVYPALGPKVNLQEAAKKWVKDKEFYSSFGIQEKDVIFETTLKGKLEQIQNRGCTHFIDDLSEVLLHPDFPKEVIKILYAKFKSDNTCGLLSFDSWNEIQRYLII